MTVSSARKIVVIIALAASLLIAGVSAFSGPGNSGDTKPGWGYGDTNHTHTGPPGSTIPKPGWGYGDTNHAHIGPPGK